MPTQSTTYNTRLTDETLEKRFRDTFRSQGGAELVDDLYASGVIVPVVDFTAAAEGSALRSDLQTAWDFSTGHSTIKNTNTTLVSTPGFWKVGLTVVTNGSGTLRTASINLTDGLSTRPVWEINTVDPTGGPDWETFSAEFVVYLRSGDSLTGTTGDVFTNLDVWYRQIADVSGNFTNPTGFTSS